MCQETALSHLDRQQLCLGIHTLTGTTVLVFSAERPALRPRHNKFCLARHVCSLLRLGLLVIGLSLGSWQSKAAYAGRNIVCVGVACCANAGRRIFWSVVC